MESNQDNSSLGAQELPVSSESHLFSKRPAGGAVSPQHKRRRVSALTSQEYSDEDWDILPMSQWSLGMCLNWLRNEVEWSEEDIQFARDWLQSDAIPGRLMKYDDIKANLEKKITNLSLGLADVKLSEHSYAPGPYAEHLKRWAECVSRPEQHITTIDEYNEKKDSCDSVMVLCYSELLKAENDDTALRELREDVLNTDQRLAQLRGEEMSEAEDVLDDAAVLDDAPILGDMEARVLPAHLTWPCFFAGKQKQGALDTHVLLRRRRLPAQNMENDAITTFQSRELINGSAILWLGAAGVGKSSYTSVIAEKLIRNMKSSLANPSLVVFRIDAFLYYITYPKPNTFRVKSVPLRHVDALVEISVSIGERKGVLLMELRENEICPAVSCHMLCSSSVKDTKKIFKEQLKAGATLVYYISPYEVWEVRAAAKMLYHLRNRILNCTCVEFVNKALERYRTVGGLPRQIFQTERIYQSFVTNIHTHSTWTDFFKTMRKNKARNLTSSAKFIIAPSCISSNTWCEEHSRVEFMFLSDYCEQKVIQHMTESHVNRLRQMRSCFGDWRTEELLLFASLQSHMRNADISMYNAEWYINPGRNVKITAACSKDNTFADTVKPCTSVRYIQEAICTKPVTELEELTLYNATMTVADCFVVDHANKRLWLFNNSLSLACHHGFKITNLQEIAECMKVEESDYTVHLCYVRSSHRGGDVGLTFL